MLLRGGKRPVCRGDDRLTMVARRQAPGRPETYNPVRHRLATSGRRESGSSTARSGKSAVARRLSGARASARNGRSLGEGSFRRGLGRSRGRRLRRSRSFRREVTGCVIMPRRREATAGRRNGRFPEEPPGLVGQPAFGQMPSVRGLLNWRAVSIRRARASQPVRARVRNEKRPSPRSRGQGLDRLQGCQECRQRHAA